MKWIKLNDEKPSESGLYLIFAPSDDPNYGLIYIAWWEVNTDKTGEWSILPVWGDAITHWMPLPSPPEKED